MFHGCEVDRLRAAKMAYDKMSFRECSYVSSTSLYASNELLCECIVLSSYDIFLILSSSISDRLSFSQRTPRVRVC